MRTSSVDQIILGILDKEHSHLTSQEILIEARQRLPAVNQSTVYRSLERLAAICKVSVSDMGTGSMVYELLTGEKHHHLVCQSCKKVFPLNHELVKAFFSEVERQNDFQLVTSHLILFGICADCREVNPTESSDKLHENGQPDSR